MNDKKPDTDNSFAGVMSELAGLRDALRLKIHLAGMDARDAWEQMQPKLHELERSVKETNTAVASSLHEAAENLRERLRQLQDDVDSGQDQ